MGVYPPSEHFHLIFIMEVFLVWNKLTEWIRNHPFPVLIAGFVLVAVICLASCQGLVNLNDSDGASIFAPVASDTNVGSTVIGG